MNKPPAFQFYADDFLSGTLNFTDAEVGLYVRLLCVQWSSGGLPDDDTELLSYSRGDTRLARVKAKFCKCADGMLRNERLEFERKKQEDYRASRSTNGKLGGRPCKAHENHVVLKTKAQKSSPSPSPTPIIHTHIESAECLEANIPTWAEVFDYARGHGVLESSARSFFDHHQGNSLWVNQYGRLIDWRTKLPSWAARDRKVETMKPARVGPTLAEVQAYAREKWGDDQRHSNWAVSFHTFWNDPKRKWASGGKFIDWQVKLTEQVSKWRL